MEDELWMARALRLATRGKGWVSPNPLVGCVIVRGRRLVGEGGHAYYGGPHAEVLALARAGQRARGATLYVNLEPCRHWGKTPPCTGAILQAKVRRVVVAMEDPNPLVSGQGLRQLRTAGVQTRVGVCAAEARSLNRVFLTTITANRPYMTLKSAMSLDGKIATRIGDSRWISGPEARAWVHHLRSEVDGLLVGSGTVLRDDPALTTHGAGRNPWRIVVDSRLRTPLSAKVWDTTLAPTCVVTTRFAPVKKREALTKRGVSVLVSPSNSPPPALSPSTSLGIDSVEGSTPRDRQVNLRWMIRQLSKLNVQHLLCEGGGELNAALLRQRLVDELFLIVAPKLIGGRTAASPVGGEGVPRIVKAHRLASWHWRPLGHDLLIHATL